MKIFWSPLAVDRLEDIYEYISKENTSAAQKMIDKIFERIESLAEYPERGRKAPVVNRKDIREVFEAEYRIIYRVEPKKIFIVSILN